MCNSATIIPIESEPRRITSPRVLRRRPETDVGGRYLPVVSFRVEPR
jgi:hypothetical protein